MKNKSKAYISKIFIENKILLFINFCVLCFICGFELKKYQLIGMSVWEYIIMILTNHYYILYCVLPILLILISKYIKGIQDIEKIRYRNLFHQTRQSTKRFAYWIFLYSISHLIIIFIIGFTKLSVSFKNEIINLTIHDELVLLLNEYTSFFGNPILAIISIVGYMLFGFTVLVSLLSYINQRYSYKRMIFISIIVYILTFIGFKTEVKTLFPLICFNNYILLHHALFVNYGIKFILIVLTELLILFLCQGKRGMVGGSFDKFVLTRKETFISMMIPMLIIMVELFRCIIMTGFSLKNVIINVLVGTSIQTSSFISWLGLTIIYMTPLFFVGVSDSRFNKYAQLPLLIRFKNKLDFRYMMEKRYIKYIFSYVLMIVVIGNLLLGLSSGTIDNLFEMFGVELSIKMLNIFFLVFITYLLFDYTLFRILSVYLGNVFSIVLLLLYKFSCFLLPDLNLLYTNFGIINLYENIGNKVELEFKILFVLTIVILYFISTYVRRSRYANN